MKEKLLEIIEGYLDNPYNVYLDNSLKERRGEELDVVITKKDLINILEELNEDNSKQ